MDLKLPYKFLYKIISNNEETKTIILRSNIANIEMINEWIQEFSKLSATSYILRTTKNHSNKFDHRQVANIIMQY